MNNPYQGEIDHLTKCLANLRMLGTIPIMIIEKGTVTNLERWKDPELKKTYDDLSKILGELLALRQKYYYDKGIEHGEKRSVRPKERYY